MFGRGYYPAQRFSAPILYGPPFLSPFRGLLGSVVSLAGLIVIANMIAPQFVEQIIPHWRSQYGGLIMVAVGLGFIRAIWRLIIPIGALGFWILAVFALTHSALPKSLALPTVPRFLSESAQTAQTTTSSLNTKPLYGTKALPDTAFFPAQQNQGLGILSKVPGVSAITTLFK